MYPTFSNVIIKEVSYTNLTGSDTRFIRGHNKLAISFDLTYEKYNDYISSRIQTVKITTGTTEYSFPLWEGNVNGNTQIVTRFDGAAANRYISDVKDTKITISVVDFRGQIGSYTYYLDMIDYSDVVVSGSVSPLNTNGRATVDLHGYLFYPSFGAVNNTLTLSYSCYDQDGARVKYGNLTPTIQSDGKFYTSLTLTGLNYEYNYSIYVEAADKVSSSSITLSTSGDPLFHWDNNDFQFNIPVYIKNGLQLQSDASIYGDNDRELMALKDNDLYLGYSSYTNEIGTTYVYGNDIQFNYSIDGGGTLNIKELRGLVNLFSMPYALEATATNQQYVEGYYPEKDQGYVFTLHSIQPSCSCTLYGNTLFVRFYCKGLTNWMTGNPSGDITDINLGTVKIYHQGKITNAEAVVSSAGTSGVTCGLMMKDLYIDEDMVAFQPHICNTTGPMDAVLTTFVIPVSVDLSKFA